MGWKIPGVSPRRIAGALKQSAVAGPALSLIAACAVFATQSDRFLTGANLSLIMQQVMVVGTLAIGQTLIILTAGIDLSVGTVMALSSVFMSSMAVEHGLPPAAAVAVGIAVSLLFGLFNGVLVTYIRLPPFIVTLGTFNIAFALTRIYTTMTITNIPPALLRLGQTFRVGETNITYGSIFVIVLYFLVWFILKYTVYGRNIYALGDNWEAARLSGVPVNRMLLGTYAFASLFIAMSALLLIARTEVGDPQAGQNANLESITAVVLGGTSLFGGRGNVLGTLIGALIVGVFRNGLQLMGVSSIYQMLITGALVIAAVSLDLLSHRVRG